MPRIEVEAGIESVFPERIIVANAGKGTKGAIRLKFCDAYSYSAFTVFEKDF